MYNLIKLYLNIKGGIVSSPQGDDRHSSDCLEKSECECTVHFPWGRNNVVRTACTAPAGAAQDDCDGGVDTDERACSAVMRSGYGRVVE